MNLYNIKDKSEQVSFAPGGASGSGAASRGCSSQETLEPLADVDALLDQAAGRVLGLHPEPPAGDEVPAARVSELHRRRFHLPAPPGEAERWHLMPWSCSTARPWRSGGFRRPLHGPVSGCVQNHDKITILTATSATPAPLWPTPSTAWRD